MRCVACYPASVHWRGRRRGAWCQGWPWFAHGTCEPVSLFGRPPEYLN